MKRLAVLVAVLAVANAVRRDGISCVAHNLVAHPLLVLVPPAGEAIHEATDPTPFQGVGSRR